MNTPNYAAVAASPVLAGMRAIPQWFLYRLDPKPDEPGKFNKVPHEPENGAYRIDPLSPAAWRDAQTTVDKVQALNAALPAGAVHHFSPGFAFTPGCGFWFLDIDKALVRTPDTAPRWSDQALDLLSMLPGAAVEVSSSGAGMHVFGRGQVPPHAMRVGTLEFYTEGRGAALTGDRLQGDCSLDMTQQISAVVAKYFPLSASTVATPDADWTEAPVKGWRRLWTDEQFHEEITKPIQRMSPGEAFSGAPSLSTLWNGDLQEVAVGFFEGDASRARLSLINRLVWKSGGNCEQVFRLCRNHERAIKDGRENLLRHEIMVCFRGFLAKYEEEQARTEKQKEETRAIGESLGESIMPTVIPLEDMTARLVYVTNGRGVMDSLEGRALTWPDALGAYAASTFTIQTEDSKGKVKEKTVPSLPVWLENPLRKTVDMLTWGPGRPEFCAPPEPQPGKSRAYNTWKGLRPYAAPEDWQQRVQPFIGHIAYLVPDAQQRGRFIQWLAHILQHPGELPHTGYLMIANTTGVGRNWLSAILARVLSGYMASGVALGPLLDGKFNGRLSGKLLATVDETREGMSDNRYTRAEALKRTVTEEFRMIDHKYGMQVVEYNCCRWLMYSNHSDALPLDKMDRRIEVIANPEWVRDEAYYADLYAKRHDPAFIASVRHYLQTLDLSGFNAGAHATWSEAKRQAVAAVTPEVDRALDAFRVEWIGDFATFASLDRFVKEFTGDQHTKRSALDHAMRRLGWSKWSQRPRMGTARVTVVSLNPLVGDVEMTALGAEAVSKSLALSEGSCGLGSTFATTA